jgi:hypothetical protein
MKLDALTGWFKSVFHHRAPLLHADLAPEPWDVVPMRPGVPRARPPAPPAYDDDEDWDAVIAAARSRTPAPPAKDDLDWDAAIARARVQTAPPRTPTPPPLPPARHAPPPSPARRAAAPSTIRLTTPRLLSPEEVRAKLDAVVRAGVKRAVPPRPSLAPRRPAEEDLPTPLPLGRARRPAGPLASRSKGP